MMHEGRVIESLEAVNILKDNMAGKACIEVSIDGMFLLICSFSDIHFPVLQMLLFKSFVVSCLLKE